MSEIDLRQLQRDLFAPPEPPPGEERTLEECFAAFDAANPHVYDVLEELALRAWTHGATRIGIAMLWETMRYNQALATEGEPWKLNNSYRALYARKLVADHPKLAGVIETRKRRSAGAGEAGLRADEGGYDTDDPEAYE